MRKIFSFELVLNAVQNKIINCSLGEEREKTIRQRRQNIIKYLIDNLTKRLIGLHLASSTGTALRGAGGRVKASDLQKK